jgi:hypothetical protein
MQLLRVRVPNFRALKDVDLTFEKDFVPQIFPLGSLNGGGKSTLLQLIFILLHDSYTKQGAEATEIEAYLRNILDYVTLDENGYGEIATLDIWNGKEVVEITFFCKTIQAICNELKVGTLSGDKMAAYLKQNNKVWYVAPRDYLNFFSDMSKKLLFCCSSYGSDDPPSLSSDFSLKYLFSDFLIELTSKVFLAAPSSQVYFFLPPEERKSLFKVGGNYNNALDKAKKSLLGFFTYDTFSVATLSGFFRTAWDKDIDEKVTMGKYGDHYSQMLHDINQVIAGKTIVPQLINTAQGSRPLGKDLIDSIIFKANDGTEIYPEDLSHGELKKLSIYAWLKANQIKNSIVLMDEIENGFHPDWQFQIVKELEEWEPSNQYILATHSYELCTAVTPSHVKHLKPQLRPKNNNDL